MARINSQILKRQRKKLGLSMEDLETRSGIDKGTIYRIESGRPGRNTRNTITKLASALKLTPDELVAPPGEDAEGLEAILYARSQLNVRISHEARNALALVAQRYDVRPIDIIEFAPLLFQLVAEESLALRRASLDALQAARNVVATLPVRFPHITERLLHDWSAQEMEDCEARSIARRDLRGALVDQYQGSEDVRPLDYDEGEQNPFVAYVRDRLAALGTGAEIEGWHEGWIPRYVTGMAEAIDYFGGDADLAEDVVRGALGMHEIPRELRGAEAVEARLAWARDTIAAWRARQVDLLEILDIKDIQP